MNSHFNGVVFDDNIENVDYEEFEREIKRKIVKKKANTRYDFKKRPWSSYGAYSSKLEEYDNEQVLLIPFTPKRPKSAIEDRRIKSTRRIIRPKGTLSLLSSPKEFLKSSWFSHSEKIVETTNNEVSKNINLSNRIKNFKERGETILTKRSKVKQRKNIEEEKYIYFNHLMVCRDERIKKKQRNEVLNQLSGQWKVIIKQLMFAYYYTNYYLKDNKYTYYNNQYKIRNLVKLQTFERKILAILYRKKLKWAIFRISRFLSRLIEIRRNNRVKVNGRLLCNFLKTYTKQNIFLHAAKRFTKNSIFLQGKLKKFVLKIKARREYLSMLWNELEILIIREYNKGRINGAKIIKYGYLERHSLVLSFPDKSMGIKRLSKENIERIKEECILEFYNHLKKHRKDIRKSYIKNMDHTEISFSATYQDVLLLYNNEEKTLAERITTVPKQYYKPESYVKNIWSELFNKYVEKGIKLTLIRRK